jgi:hypothetical protein
VVREIGFLAIHIDQVKAAFYESKKPTLLLEANVGMVVVLTAR